AKYAEIPRAHSRAKQSVGQTLLPILKSATRCGCRTIDGTVASDRMTRNAKRALVTGGAGLIGSHVVDVLVGEGLRERALDNLEPQTHRRGKPPWINEKAEFVEADLRDRDAIIAALENIDIVFHQAAYGGYMPEIAKFVHVNSLGTAQMLEVIREKNLPIKKIVVASSQAVYSEGAGECPKHGLVFPSVR